MKVLLLNTSDIDGGAARAAYRLHKGLQGIGVGCQMLVQDKTSDDSTVLAPQTKVSRKLGKLRPSLDNLPLQLYPDRLRITFSSQWLPDSTLSRVAQLCPDIINLHWSCAGYLQIETIPKFKKPLVWTLHDMWAFTGGCHYSQDCDRYTDSCGACPLLHSSNSNDLSHWIWKRKVKAWKNLNLTIVSPTSWLAKCASASSLFQALRVEVIPQGLDTKKYKPIERRLAREILNLPQDKQIVIFGSLYPNSDLRKGFHLLQPALQSLSQSGWKDQIELVAFGSSQPETLIDVGFKPHYLGRLHDDFSLALAYASADVMIVPSIYEAFGQTASESLACGTPVVAFNTSGLTDIVEHQQNGYLAQPYKVEDLAQGIAWVLENKERHQKLSDRARAKAEQEFALEIQARRYSSLFSEIAESSSKIER